MTTYIGNTPEGAKGIQAQLPIGAVIAWGSTTIPLGWLECNGQSTSAYSLLAAVIGSTVPDLRGEFIRGYDNGKGTDTGRSFGSSQTDELKSHDHVVKVVGSGDNNSQWHKIGDYPPSASDTQTTTGDSATELAGGTETRPRNIALMYIIKAFNVIGNDPSTYLTENLLTDGIDFTAGTSDSVTITIGGATPTQLWVFFDGVMQHSDQYSVSSNTITFTETIPVGVNKILVKNAKDFAFPSAEIITHNKNYIINPTFSINQRAFAGGALATGIYGYDRWKANGASNVTLSGIEATINSGILQQDVEFIEGLAGKTMTLSWEGTSQGSVWRANGDAGNFQTSPLTFTMPATGSGDIHELFLFSAGTVSNLKLELGSTVTPFEYPEASKELAKCQRYYERITTGGSSGYSAFALSACRTSTGSRILIEFKVTKRGAPTFNYSGAFRVVVSNATKAISLITLSVATLNQASIEATNASATTGQAGFFSAYNDVNAYIEFDSEL